MVATKNFHQQREPNPSGKISWEEFQKEYLTREDQYKYEWVNGKVEKTLRFEMDSNRLANSKTDQHTMYENQFFILDNLLEFFIELKIKHKIQGQLIPEGDTFFADNHRRPDIAFYTKKQIRAAKEGKKKSPPQFVIEIISTNDQANRVQEKMVNYRDAKVPIVWLIYPELKEVHIYHGKKSQVHEGDDICSAEPVIPGFLISVKDIFK